MWRRTLIEHVLPLGHFGCVVHCVNEYGVEVNMCVGPSMLPTFNQAGDIVLLHRLWPWTGRPLRHEDVVVARSPTDPHDNVCKRVRAMEGDVVLVRASRWQLQDLRVKVPPGHVWLEGDNPDNSTDSRTYGPVPLAMIRGRALMRLWPLPQLGSIPAVAPRPQSKIQRAAHRGT